MTEPPWEAMIARVLAGESAIDVAREYGADARSLRLRTQHRRPNFAAQNKLRAAASFRRIWKDPKHNPMVLLTPDEKQDYDVLVKSGVRRKEALISILREDLIPLLEASSLTRRHARGEKK